MIIGRQGQLQLYLVYDNYNKKKLNYYYYYYSYILSKDLHAKWKF